ncbi:MAG: FHA domain-containing protein [Desulfobacterales bacterium]|jgi:hypothetical protein|nr:FHA domain-containing protein [Desulfobacterales bacterium]
MLFRSLSKLSGRSEPAEANAQKRGEDRVPPAGGVAKLVNSSGRIGLPLLQRMVAATGREEFLRFMQRPVLAGSGIRLGSLAAASAAGRRELNRTVLFEPVEEGSDGASASESLQHAIYPLVKGEFAASAGMLFSIGRSDSNDLIIPDYAISKKHALIEIRGGDYLLRDCGSTNGTTLNGERLEGKPVRLHDGALISFARYEFSFLSPEALYATLQPA